jgi:hypothetical protein
LEDVDLSRASAVTRGRDDTDTKSGNENYDQFLMNLNEVSTVNEEHAYCLGFYAISYVSSAFLEVSA